MRPSTWFYAVSTSLVASAIGYFAKVEYAATAERRILFSRKSQTASAIWNMTAYLRAGVERLTANKPWYSYLVPNRIIVWWRRRVFMWQARRRLEAEFMAYVRHLASKVSEAELDRVETVEQSRGYKAMVGVHPGMIDARFPVRVELTTFSARRVRDNLFEQIGQACELPTVVNFGPVDKPDERAPGPIVGSSHDPLESRTGEPNRASLDPYPVIETKDGDTKGVENVPLPFGVVPPEPKKWSIADTAKKMESYRQSIFASLRPKAKPEPELDAFDFELPSSGSEYGTSSENPRSPSIASTIKLEDERTQEETASTASTEHIGALPGAFDRDILPSTAERRIAARLCTEEPFEELEEQKIYYLLPGKTPRQLGARGWTRRYTILLDRPELPIYRVRRERAQKARINLESLEKAPSPGPYFLVEEDAPVPMNRAYDVASETYWTPKANPKRPPSPVEQSSSGSPVVRLEIASSVPLPAEIDRKVQLDGVDDSAFLKQSVSRTEAPSMPVNNDVDERPFVKVGRPPVVAQAPELAPAIDNRPITNASRSVKGRSAALGLGAAMAKRRAQVSAGALPENNSDSVAKFLQVQVAEAYATIDKEEFFGDKYAPNYGGFAVALASAFAERGNLSGADHDECNRLVKMIDDPIHAELAAAALFARGKKQANTTLSLKAVEIGASAAVNKEVFYLSTYGIDLSLKSFINTYSDPAATSALPHIRELVEHFGKDTMTPLQPGDASRIHTLDTGSVIDEEICERVMAWLIAIKAMFVSRGLFPKMRHGQSVLMHPKDVEAGWPEKLVFVGWFNSSTREVHRGPRKTGPSGKIQHEYLSWKAPAGSETPAGWPLWQTMLFCYPILLPAGSGPDAARARD
jgi:hypothetical protein